MEKKDLYIFVISPIIGIIGFILIITSILPFAFGFLYRKVKPKIIKEEPPKYIEFTWRREDYGENKKWMGFSFIKIMGTP
ncbi:MAG: hypothetical protein WA977_02835 [Halobacteriota archaeon]